MQTAFVEAFNGRLRDECFNENLFGNLAEARRIVETLRTDYTPHRPQRSLDGQTPTEFPQRLRSNRPVSLEPRIDYNPIERKKHERMLHMNGTDQGATSDHYGFFDRVYSRADTENGTDDRNLAPDSSVAYSIGGEFLANFVLRDVTEDGDPVISRMKTNDDVLIISNDANLPTTLAFFETIYVMCFAPGTRIATPNGTRCVETLGIGDLI